MDEVVNMAFLQQVRSLVQDYRIKQDDDDTYHHRLLQIATALLGAHMRGNQAKQSLFQSCFPSHGDWEEEYP